MIEAATEQMLDTVTTARTATDLFGPIGGPARGAKRTFRLYAARLHPDRAAAACLDPAVADVAFKRLTSYYEEWISSGTHSPATDPGKPDFVITGRGGTYTAVGIPTAGTVTAVYAGTSADGAPVAIKIPRSASSSRFIEGERAALEKIAALTGRSGDAWLAPYFPRLLDTAAAGGPGSRGQRKVNVLNALGAGEGFVDLATVAAAHPGGLDGRDWAWIHRRLLRAVAGAGLAGVVHGAIVAENVLIHPEGHGVVLAGWSLATVPGQPLPGRIASRADAYPPDAAELASPALDVYMVHALMRSMLAPTERRQLAFARGCMQTSPGMRPDAASLLTEYDDLLEDLYGRRRFRPFPYTVAPAS